MVVIENETDETESQDMQESQQNAKLDALQSAVDEINTEISQIEESITSLQSSLNANLNSQIQTLTSDLNAQIQSLILNLEDFINTTQINADVGNFKNLYATVLANLENLTADYASITKSATIASATITDETVTSSQIQNLQSAVATISELTVTLLHISTLVVTDLTAEKVTADEIDAEIAKADDVRADGIKANNISGGTWHTPVSTPDNTQLLKIEIPFYQGIIQMQSEDNEINLTIGNNSVISFTQTGNYIYRIERNESATVIYLMNIGDTINYRLLYVGAETFMESSSELVDRTAYEQNVSGEVNDIVFFSDAGDIFRVGDLGEKQNKILSVPVAIGGVYENTVEGALSRLAGLLNSALVSSIYYDELTETLYFPYNSVAYDEETESLTVSGLNQVYANETLWFSLV